MSSSSSTPSGWYPDPQNASQERYWDGSTWSDQTRPTNGGGFAPPPPPGPGGAYAPPMGGGGYVPSGYGYAAAGPPPPNYLAQAILTTLLCCLPFGIVSIVKSTQVNSKWSAGDAQGAREASEAAKKWAWISFGVGLAVSVLYFGFVVSLGST